MKKKYLLKKLLFCHAEMNSASKIGILKQVQNDILRRYKKNTGFTIIELLVAITLSLIVLSALIAFFFRGSKLIQIGQDQAKVPAMAQFVLNKMVKDIETGNTQVPTILGITEATWKSLPALPYTSVELYPYPDTGGTITVPAVPAARKFANQVGINDKYHRWYPNPNSNSNENPAPDRNSEVSNSLVFYKVENANTFRITYRLDSFNNFIREQQNNPASSFTSPAPDVQRLLGNVQYIQFTYPVFEQEMYNNADFENNLNAMSPNDREVYINQNYRKAIGIKISVLGATIGQNRKKALELITQVMVRN